MSASMSSMYVVLLFVSASKRCWLNSSVSMVYGLSGSLVSVLLGLAGFIGRWVVVWSMNVQGFAADVVLKAVLVVAMACVGLLAVGPIADAWLNYGVVTGVLATLLVGVPVVGVGWMCFDVVLRDS